MTNPISGRNSPGFRFRFCVRSITHKTLYLPLAMKQLPEIKRLMEGYAPFSVFHCLSMDTVRHTFNELRKKYDFAYWCATEYYIHDMADADNIIPLRLNQHQHQIIDTFERRYFEQKHAAYIISKSFRRAGVTTCVQAYILWRQIYYFGRASNTCTASSINAHHSTATQPSVTTCANGSPSTAFPRSPKTPTSSESTSSPTSPTPPSPPSST